MGVTDLHVFLSVTNWVCFDLPISRKRIFALCAHNGSMISWTCEPLKMWDCLVVVSSSRVADVVHCHHNSTVWSRASGFDSVNCWRKSVRLWVLWMWVCVSCSGCAQFFLLTFLFLITFKII